MVSYPDGEQGRPADFLNKALTNKQAHKKELDEQGKGRSRDSEPKHKLRGDSLSVGRVLVFLVVLMCGSTLRHLLSSLG